MHLVLYPGSIVPDTNLMTLGAKYVLMNPLSPFGRGVGTQQLAYSNEEMIALKRETSPLISERFEIVYIRFPNYSKKPIGRCPLGSIPYIFSNGDIAVCPYMVFASNGSDLYQPNDFLVGNIFEGADIAKEINSYDINGIVDIDCRNSGCAECSRGCYAIKISNNQVLTDCDIDMCPVKGGVHE